eukprot:5509291-Prymnesium_polylepis.2
MSLVVCCRCDADRTACAEGCAYAWCNLARDLGVELPWRLSICAPENQSVSVATRLEAAGTAVRTERHGATNCPTFCGNVGSGHNNYTCQLVSMALQGRQLCAHRLAPGASVKPDAHPKFLGVVGGVGLCTQRYGGCDDARRITQACDRLV